MSTLQTPQIIELVHVAFLDVLSTKVKPERYVLKGGTNLRYFFKSLRYSEDIDLDVNGLEPWQLEEKVDAVLDSPQLRLVLRASDLTVEEYSKPKQTETTRRWKVGIGASKHAELIRTRIEFSNRNGETRYRLDAIPHHIVRPYGLRAPSVQHYVGDAPAEQKVTALARRTQVQARDVFDLDLLFRTGSVPQGSLAPETLVAAIDRAAGISFAEYRDQVLPFLEPDARVLYETETAWDEMQTFVVERLEEAR